MLFLFLGLWTAQYLTTSNLYVALGAYFVFAVLHSAAPVIMRQIRQIEVPLWSHMFPALALVLVLIPIFRLTQASFLIWPLVLCVDVVAVLLAAFTATLIPVLIVLLLTFVVIGGWMFRLPSELTGLPSSLLLLGGFAVFFMIAASWGWRQLSRATGLSIPKAGKLFGTFDDPANLAIQLPALSAILPFLLLIMVTLRLPLTSPSLVFGLGLVLIVLLLGMTRFFSLELLPAVGLVCVLALDTPGIWAISDRITR